MNINDVIPLKLFIFILGLQVVPVFVVPGSRSQYLLSRLYRPTVYVYIVELCNHNPSSTTSLRHRSTHGVCLLNLFLSYLRDIKICVICDICVTFHLRMSSSDSGSYAPFFISRIHVPDSKACTVCHIPIGILTATLNPLGSNMNESEQIRSSSS